MNFRKDINGLRAIAVIAVVLFHFSANALPGGFIGVDIFFAISGYLMTSIVVRSIQENKFSYITFLIARVRRIIPALIAVCFLVILFGYATLDPTNYSTLVQHTRDSLLFFSNQTYQAEAGYFDAVARSKILLHTWSLSVEWQFYLLYPLLIGLFCKLFGVRFLAVIIGLLALASFIASVLMIGIDKEFAYFSLTTRAWQMLCGGLAFFCVGLLSSKMRPVAEIAGLLIMSISILFIDQNVAWPGYIAALPIFGAFLLLIANNPNTLLSGKFFNTVGVLSYAIYLVHWPIIAFSYLLQIKLSVGAYLCLTIILSSLLHVIVERRRNQKWGLVISFVGVLALTLWLSSTEGAKWRFEIPDHAQSSLAPGTVTAENTWAFHNVNEKDRLKYVFYGDSFTGHYGSFLSRVDEPIGVLYSGLCFSTINYYSFPTPECRSHYERLKERIGPLGADVLVFSQAWLADLNGLIQRDGEVSMVMNHEDYVDLVIREIKLIKSDLNVAKVMLVGHVNPFSGGAPTECLSGRFAKTIYAKLFGEQICEDRVPRYPLWTAFDDLMESRLQHEEGFEYFRPTSVICDQVTCKQIESNQSLYSDQFHLSSYGADVVGEALWRKLRDYSSR